MKAPELPIKLYPYNFKNPDDVLNILPRLTRNAYRDGLFHGYDDLDTSLMAFLIACGLSEDQIHEFFQVIFESSYDQRRTQMMYERAKQKIESGEAIRGTGTFIKKLKEMNLKEIENFSRQLQRAAGKDKPPSAESYRTISKPQVLEWTDPIPFDDFSLLPDFPVEVLPEPGRSMVKAVSEINQVDPGMTASIYLADLSASLAKKGEVNLISHTEPINIYTCSILPSGERKSSTLAEMTKPIYEYQARLQEAMKDTIRVALNAHKIREVRLIKLQKTAANADNPAERKKYEREAAEVAREITENPVPKTPLLIVDDVTTEACGIHTAENNERMAVISAEGGIFDLMAGLYHEKNGNIDLYLKSHSGDSWSSHRVGREAKTMQSPALTMCLTVQPDVIREIGINKQFRGRGLLARFLYSMCKSQVGYRGRQIKSVPESIIIKYQEHIECLMDIPMNLTTLKLSPDAQRLWDEFYGDIENDMRENGSLHYLTDWGSKLPGATARIAGLLHFAEYGSRAGEHPISVNCVSASAAIGAYYKEHALATFGVMEEDPRIKAAKLIYDFIRKYHDTTFKVRHVLENKRALKTSEDVMPGIKVLLERGYIAITEKIYPGVGRPEAIEYLINPKVKTIEKPSAEYSNSQKKNSFAEFAETSLRI